MGPTTPRPRDRPGREPRSERGSERGAASLLVVACISVLMLLTTVLGVGGAMVLAQRRAQAAADLVALAAATHGCPAATAVARDNGGRMSSCAVRGREAQVEVLVRGPDAFGWGHDFAAVARAGPVGTR